jgi:hypothetical protein
MKQTENKLTEIDNMANTERNNDMTGVLFTVKEKKSANHPDFTGNVEIGGVKYSLSGWSKVSGNGNAYTSLALREWVERESAPQTQTEAPAKKGPGRPKKAAFLDD